MLELAQPAVLGHIVFGAGEGSHSVEKNLKDHFVMPNGKLGDGRLPSGTVAWEAQFRGSATAQFRYSWWEDNVTRTGTPYGIWTSKPNLPDGESGINVSIGTEPVNLYFSSSAANTVLEIRIWRGYA